MKNNKAITMISLVVTIIILIIIAGISINLAIGENGLLNRSKTAANETEKAALIEKIKLELLDKQRENIGRELTQDEIIEILNKYGDVQYNDENVIIGLKPADKDYVIPIEELYDIEEKVKILEYTNSLKMTEGDSQTLNLIYTGIIISKKFTSNNEEVVTVNEKGEISAIASGNSIVTVEITDRKGNVLKGECSITVVDKVEITDYNNITIVAGNSATPTLNYTGNIKSKEFVSSNTQVATVDNQTGKVKGISAGSTTITVKLINENDVEVTKDCTVTVQTAIAQIDTTYYSSLQNAIDTVPASTNTTVIMVANTTEKDITIEDTKNINLNVNSKTITGNITNSGSLSLQNGDIIGNGEITINNTGTLTITSMNITNSNRVISNSGTVNLKSGNIKCTNGGEHTVINSKVFTMTGGSIVMTGSGSGAAFISYGTLNITGGTITSTIYGLVARGGTTTVNNATLKCTGNYPTLLVDTSGTAKMTNCTITNTVGGIGGDAVNNTLNYSNCTIYSRASNYGISGNIAGKVLATTNTSTGQAQENITIYNTGHTQLTWPTWTEGNGQDDITWDVTTSSSGTHTYTVKKSAHGNETGNYAVHIYSYINGASNTLIGSLTLKF